MTFRTIITALLVVTLGFAVADADLIAVDDFESYSAGSALNTGSGGWGWFGDWSAQATQVTVQSGVLPSFGQSMQIVTTGDNSNIARRTFNTQSGTVYAGLVLQTTGGWDAGDFLQFYANTNLGASDTIGLSGGVRNAGSSPYFARIDGTGNSSNSSTAFHSDDATRQVVLKFSKSGGTYDQIDVFVDQATEGSPDVTQSTGSSSVSALSNFHIRTYNIEAGQSIFVDSLKIGTTYDDVLASTPLPTLPDTTYEAFQEGVSPSPSYVADSVTIRSGGLAGTNQDNDPDFENIVGRVGSDFMRNLYEFDLSEINTEAGGSPISIDSARLELVTRPDGSGSGQGSGTFTIDLHEYGFDFVEGSATWNDPAGDGSDTTVGGTPGTLLTSVDVSGTGITGGSLVTLPDSEEFRAAIAAALEEPDETLRMLLKMQDESGSGNLFIRFRDEVYSSAEYRPRLVVGYSLIAPVPEPSTFALAVIGLLGVAGFIRRRKR